MPRQKLVWNFWNSVGGTPLPVVHSTTTPFARFTQCMRLSLRVVQNLRVQTYHFTPLPKAGLSSFPDMSSSIPEFVAASVKAEPSLTGQSDEARTEISKLESEVPNMASDLPVSFARRHHVEQKLT